ncbi:MAG TPA: hypothetical protein IAA98_09160 [Candidatus Avipropionibacterium avicola]|uniref:NfeD-like C-terminal domain-containing protein n=1 Tax=Candidatus Avipropionibacterium avicola TaxID=2840701 RepID=A0A9D1GZP7_9ACTN|nr:hypothetical protein [Candidatus Avipropionibacterium avicola]
MTVFLIIGSFGVLFLLASLILGDFFDGIFDGVGGDLFSGAALGGFLGVFGFVGALTLTMAPDNLVLAIVVGLVAGILVGLAVGWVTMKLRNGGDEHNVTSASLVGLAGTVISDVPAEGYGEVSVVSNGHITKLNARSRIPLTAGTPVEISNVLSATAVEVKPRD